MQCKFLYKNLCRFTIQQTLALKAQFKAGEQANFLVDLIARKLANSSNSMVLNQVLFEQACSTVGKCAAFCAGGP